LKSAPSHYDLKKYKLLSIIRQAKFLKTVVLKKASKKSYYFAMQRVFKHDEIL
jgi:hypothetical protein